MSLFTHSAKNMAYTFDFFSPMGDEPVSLNSNELDVFSDQLFAESQNVKLNAPYGDSEDLDFFTSLFSENSDEMDSSETKNTKVEKPDENDSCVVYAEMKPLINFDKNLNPMVGYNMTNNLISNGVTSGFAQRGHMANPLDNIPFGNVNQMTNPVQNNVYNSIHTVMDNSFDNVFGVSNIFQNSTLPYTSETSHLMRKYNEAGEKMIFSKNVNENGLFCTQNESEAVQYAEARKQVTPIQDSLLTNSPTNTIASSIEEGAKMRSKESKTSKRTAHEETFEEIDRTRVWTEVYKMNNNAHFHFSMKTRLSPLMDIVPQNLYGTLKYRIFVDVEEKNVVHSFSALMAKVEVINASSNVIEKEGFLSTQDTESAFRNVDGKLQADLYVSLNGNLSHQRTKSEYILQMSIFHASQPDSLVALYKTPAFRIYARKPNQPPKRSGIKKSIKGNDEKNGDSLNISKFANYSNQKLQKSQKMTKLRKNSPLVITRESSEENPSVKEVEIVCTPIMNASKTNMSLVADVPSHSLASTGMNGSSVCTPTLMPPKAMRTLSSGEKSSMNSFASEVDTLFSILSKFDSKTKQKSHDLILQKLLGELCP